MLKMKHMKVNKLTCKMFSNFFSACEPTRDYIYFKPSGPNDNLVIDAVAPPGRGMSLVTHPWGWGGFGAGKIYQARPDPLSVKECGTICNMNPTCQAWSARTMRGSRDGCKLFTTKDNYNEDVEFWGTAKAKVPIWMSGERGCFGKNSMQNLNTQKHIHFEVLGFNSTKRI